MTDWRSKRFGRSAATYHGVTPVQARMAATLAGMLPIHLEPARILELGSGTGHLTQALLERYPRTRILSTDLSTAMLREAELRMEGHPGVRWEVLDGREPRHAESPFDVVASNAMVQWFPDLPAHLRACRAILAPGGRLAVGGFCHDHFPELDAILRSDEFSYPEGPGHDPAWLPQMLGNCGFDRWEIATREWIEVYPSAGAFLSHLRESGANRPPPQGKPLGKEGLRRLLARIEERCGVPGGVAITWKPWFAVAS
ncbi:MAG TPA: methyltransferase [Fibrobacteria bacterium]|nr:methyltransferase [Fibrobacteria bacterium]HOX51399.1 methyltransferase [Fibrobacteria bacterium]